MTQPASAFAQLMAALQQVLAAAHQGLAVHVNRVRPVSSSVASVILLRLVSARRDTSGPLGATDWQTTIEVECAARTPSGQDPAQAVDALLASAWAAVLAPSVSLPGVLDLDSEPDIAWEFDAGETPLASATFRLVVRHRTLANSLQPWP